MTQTTKGAQETTVIHAVKANPVVILIAQDNSVTIVVKTNA